MSMGWQRRHSNPTGAPTPVERLVTLAALATLTATVVLIIADSLATAPEPTATPTAQVTEAIDAGAALIPETAVPAATPSFVESASPAGGTIGIETPRPLDGFDVITGEAGLFVVAGDSSVNVRAMPGVDSDAVGQIAPGDSTLTFATGATATDGTETWMQVEYAGVSGWVRSDLMNPTDAN